MAGAYICGRYGCASSNSAQRVEIMWDSFVQIYSNDDWLNQLFDGEGKFAERALPSVGVVPFLQSFICGLENECLNETYENSSAYGNAR